MSCCVLLNWYLENSEDPDEMQHGHQGLRCLLRQDRPSEKEIQHVLEIVYALSTLYIKMLRGTNVKMVGRRGGRCNFVFCFMRGSRKLCQRGSNSDNVFFDEGREVPSSTKEDNHRPANDTPFQWRFAGGPMMAQHCMLAR